MFHNDHPAFVKLAVTAVLVSFVAFAFSGGCTTVAIRPDSEHYEAPIKKKVTVTGYCNCQKCCGWEYTWYGRPVYSGGKSKGKRKQVGITSSGSRAKKGTLAGDLSKYPYGTVVEIPGYGFGRVEDIGGAIKGDHFDAWFRTHDSALDWGKKKLEVKIWLPKKKGKSH